jgi:hypothetical protein
MGGSKLGLEAAYQQARSAAFEFGDVTEDRVELVALDQYLSAADINPANTFFSKMLDADRLFVVTAVIKSTKFTFAAQGSSGASLQLDVPLIQQTVGVQVNVAAVANNASKLTFEGGTHLVFGFQAVQLFYHLGTFTAIRPVQDVAAKALGELGDTGAEYLMSDATFVSLP